MSPLVLWPSTQTVLLDWGSITCTLWPWESVNVNKYWTSLDGLLSFLILCISQNIFSFYVFIRIFSHSTYFSEYHNVSMTAKQDLQRRFHSHRVTQWIVSGSIYMLSISNASYQIDQVPLSWWGFDKGQWKAQFIAGSTWG